MKISREQFEKAVKYALEKKGVKTSNADVSEEELKLLIEILKSMPEAAVRHLGYSRVRKDMVKITGQDIAEKIILKQIVDKLMKDS